MQVAGMFALKYCMIFTAAGRRWRTAGFFDVLVGLRAR